MSKIIGIDLGTANTRVAVMEAGGPVLIPFPGGSTSLPSVVAVPGSGPLLIGEEARRQAAANWERTIFSAKRNLGSDWRMEINGGRVNLQKVVMNLLARCKAAAEAHLGEPVRRAVIAAPGPFDYRRRQLIREAARMAGLEVERFLHEGSAAALACGTGKGPQEKVLTFDLGGGCLEVSVADIGGGVVEMLAVGGDTRLGGQEFDERIVGWLVDDFRKTDGVDLSRSGEALQRLREAAEHARIELTTAATATIYVSRVCGAPTPRHLHRKLSRAKFNELTAPLVERAMKPVRQALSDAGLKASELNRVLLAGGAGSIPAVREALEGFTGRSALPMGDGLVALGAAIQGGILNHDPALTGALLMDVTSISLGIETEGGVFTPLIPRNTTVPTKQAQTFATSADNQTCVEVHVLQGEGDRAAENRSLGRFQFTGIAPAPKGEARMELIFDLDAGGNLTVSLREVSTGRVQAFTPGLSDSPPEPQPEAPLPVENPPPKGPEKPPSPPVPDDPGFRAQAVTRFLTVYDNLERALKQSTADKAYEKGIELTMKSLRQVLSDLGAEPFGRAGEPFDPKLHNALSHRVDPLLGESVVVQVFQSGFRLDGRVIRVALVEVAN